MFFVSFLTRISGWTSGGIPGVLFHCAVIKRLGEGFRQPLYPHPPMKHNIELPEADFFQVYLRGHLIDHHFPQRDNKNFIETRSDDAYDTFVSARLEGKPVPIARELAMRSTSSPDCKRFTYMS